MNPQIAKNLRTSVRALAAVALLASAWSASAQQVPYGPPSVTPPYDSIVMTEPVAGSDIPSTSCCWKQSMGC